jgi:hypothetical protein
MGGSGVLTREGRIGLGVFRIHDENILRKRPIAKAQIAS